MDIVALEETRLPDSGSIKEINFTFFWQVKSPDETSKQGIDFAVRNTLLGSIIPPADGSERILSLHPHSSVGPVTLISAYICSTSVIPRRSKGQILWRTGHRHQGNPWEKAAVHSRRAKRQSWWRSKPRVLSSFRYYPSLCLLELCCHHSPCIGNMLFNTKPEHWIGDTQDLSTGTSSLTWSSADAPVFQASRSGAVFRVLIAIRPDSPLVCSKVKPPTR